MKCFPFSARKVWFKSSFDLQPVESSISGSDHWRLPHDCLLCYWNITHASLNAYGSVVPKNPVVKSRHAFKPAWIYPNHEGKQMTNIVPDFVQLLPVMGEGSVNLVGFLRLFFWHDWLIAWWHCRPDMLEIFAAGIRTIHVHHRNLHKQTKLTGAEARNQVD